MPLAATLATEAIYEGFLGAPEEQRTFFHGHTYTGNPLACAAALASLETFERSGRSSALQPKIRLLAGLLDEIEAMPSVAEVRGRGFMVGIDLGEHDPALRIGHRVAWRREARGDHPAARGHGRADATAVDLEGRPDRLVEITGEAIEAAVAPAARTRQLEPRRSPRPRPT